MYSADQIRYALMDAAKPIVGDDIEVAWKIGYALAPLVLGMLVQETFIQATRRDQVRSGEVVPLRELIAEDAQRYVISQKEAREAKL